MSSLVREGCGSFVPAVGLLASRFLRESGALYVRVMVLLLRFRCILICFSFSDRLLWQLSAHLLSILNSILPAKTHSSQAYILLIQKLSISFHARTLEYPKTLSPSIRRTSNVFATYPGQARSVWLSGLSDPSG